jgi:hypothetical protein
VITKKRRDRQVALAFILGFLFGMFSVLMPHPNCTLDSASQSIETCIED